MSPLAIFFLFLIHSSLAANTNIYNVQNYGAKSDGKTDSSKAFLSAWAEACASNTPATINVPSGKYLIHNANFNGQTCKSKAITIQIDGTLLAPSDYNVIGNDENWIKFEKVNGVSIYGGTFDGQGAGLWACQNSNNKNCPDGTTQLIPKTCIPTTLSFLFYVKQAQLSLFNFTLNFDARIDFL
ncbi:hypothetical protein H5410_006919 [Solanum commersonii]|uniref:Polygalacturonase n=1 Tax=Solanum commersonii TaxID=4109 RepID=A0A9J6AAN4_SOLCO|nr:hypothetical protein H5410_006899 [Solanum commersonii]KAG5621701.1 hypothetical protein H5410_006919 [Solanum commersonii]